VSAYVIPGDPVSSSLLSVTPTLFEKHSKTPHLHAIYDYHPYADIAKGAIKGQATSTALELLFPELTPVLELGKKVGTVKQAFDAGTTLHDLKNFDSHFGKPSLSKYEKPVVAPPLPPPTRPPIPIPKPQPHQPYLPGSRAQDPRSDQPRFVTPGYIEEELKHKKKHKKTHEVQVWV
jgi:hypothetical protein